MSAVPALFVYNSTAVPCTGHRRGLDRFETALRDVLLQDGGDGHLTGLLRRTTSPAEASLFYHPACLTDALFRLRGTLPRPRAIAEARALERSVLAEVEALGYAHKPHVVNALRCSGDGREHGDARAFYPTLWDPRRYARLCQESTGRVDERRSVPLPYCVSPPAGEPPAVDAPRRIRIIFIGSNLSKMGRRRAPLDAAARTPGAELVLLSRAGLRAAGGRAALARAREAMRDAAFTLCPAGDTPESSRIYEALARGSVPLVDASFRGPRVVPDWGAISWTIRLDAGGRLALPGARRERRLREEVWRHRRSFLCERASAPFARYVGQALGRLVREPTGAPL